MDQSNGRFPQELLVYGMKMFFSPASQELIKIMNIDLPRDDIKSLINTSWEMMESRKLHNQYENSPINPYNIVEDRGHRFNNKNYFYELLHGGVLRALEAVQYNYDTFMQLSHQVKQLGYEIMKDCQLDRPQTIGLTTQKLVFEYEHFTLHSRIVLDRLNWYLNYFFMTDTGNLYKLYRTLSNTQSSSPRITEIINSIDKHRIFLDQLISSDKSISRTERDKLAHREEIRFTNVNIIWNPGGKIDVKLITALNPFGAEADSVLLERKENLFNFVSELLLLFFANE